jgi:hypothetical protein
MGIFVKQITTVYRLTDHSVAEMSRFYQGKDAERTVLGNIVRVTPTVATIMNVVES